MKRYGALLVAIGLVGAVSARPVGAATTFSFGGYAKLDVLSTYYFNGDVAPESPLRDFHLPSQIPAPSGLTLMVVAAEPVPPLSSVTVTVMS